MDIAKMFADLEATKKQWLDEEGRHQAAMKELASQVLIAQETSAKQIAVTKRTTDAAMTELQQQVEPTRIQLAQLQAQVVAERGTLTALKDNQQQEFQTTRAALRAELDSLEAQIAEKQRILGAVTKDLAELAAKHF